MVRLTVHAKRSITSNQVMKIVNEKSIQYHEHNLISALEYNYDYGWRLRLHQHSLLNCRLPYEDYSKLQTEDQSIDSRPNILPIIGALSFLNALKEPITPDETANRLAGYFADRSETETAESLLFQIPYLRNARYAHHLLLINDLEEIQCKTKKSVH